MSLVQQIAEIEEEMARTQKNKATEKHIGLLKAKLAKLRREILTPKGSKGGGEGFDVTKAGDTRIGLIGFPSVGKSTLLTKLTGTLRVHNADLYSWCDSLQGSQDSAVGSSWNYRGSKGRKGSRSSDYWNSPHL